MDVPLHDWANTVVGRITATTPAAINAHIQITNRIQKVWRRHLLAEQAPKIPNAPVIVTKQLATMNRIAKISW